MTCHNLPKSGFTSVHRSGDGSLTRTQWQWSTWEETASVVNARHSSLDRKDARHCHELEQSSTTLEDLAMAVNAVIDKAPEEECMAALREHLGVLEQEMKK